MLASNSPRRRELLSGLGVDYEVKLLPGIDETYPDTLKGEEIPIYIARGKGRRLSSVHAGRRTYYHCRYHSLHRRRSLRKA